MKNEKAEVAEKRAYWQGHIEAWKQSGLSQIDFCKTRSLALSTFQFWRKKISQSSSAPPRFYPLAVLPSFETGDKPSSGLLRVILGNRRFVLEIGDDFSEEVLKKLIIVLEQL